MSDLQARLAEACESVGIEAHEACYDCAVGPRGCPYDSDGAEDCPPNCKSLVLKRFLPIPELIEKLEGWCGDDSYRIAIWSTILTQMVMDRAERVGISEWALGRVLLLPESYRAEAAIATVRKVEGKG